MKPTSIQRSCVIVISALVSLFCFTYIFAQPNQNPQDPNNPATSEDDMGWRIRDFRPYITALEELEKLNREYSENILKLAIDEYATGIDILEDMESEIVNMKAAFKKKDNLNERWYWQEIDRRNQEKRQIYAKKREAKMKAVHYFTRAIFDLDKVQNLDVRNEKEFKNFQIRLFQAYVSTQYDLQNFKPCIPILERYITLTDRTKKDPWAYRYLASCYGYMEKVLEKTSYASEEEILKYKSKKNRSLLQAAEIEYGVDSPHFKQLQEVVELDEKRSERINNFQ